MCVEELEIPELPQSLTPVVQSQLKLDEVCTERTDLIFQKQLGVLACKKAKQSSDPGVHYVIGSDVDSGS